MVRYEIVNGKMLGAIVGDIVGSVYEFRNTKTTDFELFRKGESRFTDDTVMTLAVAKWLLTDKEHSYAGLVGCMQELGRKYPDAGYGCNFALLASARLSQAIRQLGQRSGYACKSGRALCRHA